MVALLAALAAVAGHLPALGAWWNQDDWGLLARAVGLGPGADLPVRWLSRRAYFAILVPLAHLDPVPYAISRLVLLALACAGLVRVARRLGLTTLQAGVAGLLLAGSQLTFTPLYWAAGVQDLLAVACGIWAVERALAGGDVAYVAAVVLALAALASKETQLVVALALPWSLRLHGRSAPWRRAAAGLVVLAAIAALLLAWHGFTAGAEEPYARGGPITWLSNLGAYGWWLLTPGPLYAAHITLVMTVAGWLLWALWLVWGLACARQGWPVPLVTVIGAGVGIAPVLLLSRHVLPYLALPAAVMLCLVMADLLPRRWRLTPPVAALLLVGIGAWAFLGMQVRLDRRQADGLPADPLVQRTAIAFQTAKVLRGLPLPPTAQGGLVLLQPPDTEAEAEVAARLGPRWVIGSVLHRALDGALGPRLILGRDVPTTWANSLAEAPPGAIVLADAGIGFKIWGPVPQALLYLALTDVGHGLFARARDDLARAGRLSGQTVAFFYDPDNLLLPMSAVMARKDAFLAFLAAGAEDGRSAWESGGVQDLFLRLLGACTGADVDSLRTGHGEAAPSTTR